MPRIVYTLTALEVTQNDPIEGHSGQIYGTWQRVNGIMTASIRDSKTGTASFDVSEDMYNQIKSDLLGHRPRMLRRPNIVPTARIVEDDAPLSDNAAPPPAQVSPVAPPAPAPEPEISPAPANDLQSAAVAADEIHNLDVAGSIPASATLSPAPAPVEPEPEAAPPVAPPPAAAKTEKPAPAKSKGGKPKKY